jgi:hypothetical protein
MGSREGNEGVVALCQETVRTGRRRQKWGTVVRRRWETGMGTNAREGDVFFQVKKCRGFFAE